MTPIYLYYGSASPIEGEFIFPKKGADAKSRSANLHVAVYAFDSKEIAIAVALVKCKGVKGSSIRFSQNPPAVVYEGWPDQEDIYLYTLSLEKFLQTSMKKQWMSLVPVKPLKTEKLNVANYTHLIKRASEDEKTEWLKIILHH